MKSAIGQAFENVCERYPEDRVVADPELNRRYIIECRNLGLDAPVRDLNRSLLNLRKSGSRPKKERSRKTSFRDEDDYRFASEIAARFLERRDRMSLDEIICDPERVREFDDLAARIAPGYSPLQYRWAALNLRKIKALPPEIISHALPSTSVTVTSVNQLVVNDVSSGQGLYVFYNRIQTLYVGEASNLKKRVRTHLDHSDNKGLARWLWEHGVDEVFIELHRLEASVTTRIRRAL
jgi:site-specific DNA-methyltransferase (adenine-specific)